MKYGIYYYSKSSHVGTFNISIDQDILLTNVFITIFWLRAVGNETTGDRCRSQRVCAGSNIVKSKPSRAAERKKIVIGGASQKTTDDVVTGTLSQRITSGNIDFKQPMLHTLSCHGAAPSRTLPIQAT